MEAKKDFCFLCFEALANKVGKTQQSKVSSLVVNPSDATKCPMFVTWKKQGKLRGCIGCFDPLPLYSGLQQYAVVAGTQDHRFSPIPESELPSLECGISLLHSFEPANNALDWEIGVHGIRLFIDGRSATFLPEVAKEWKWSKGETLIELAQKAGFTKKYDQAAIDRSRVERYQSAKCVATWAEYQDYIQSH
jgi:uncharacterized protein (TIGR00296 family)